MEKIEMIQIDYQDIEVLFNKKFGYYPRVLDNTYQNINNDTYLRYSMPDEYLWHESDGDYNWGDRANKEKDKPEGGQSIRSALNFLCNYDIIPAGEYLVRISW